MKRTLPLSAAALLLAVTVSGCGAALPRSSQPAATYISTETAQAMALNSTKIAAADATISATELVAVEGIPCYRVEFTAAGQSYACAVHAETGEVVTADYRAQSGAAPEVAAPLSSGNAVLGATTTAAGQLDEATAKAIALDHAGVSAADVTYTKCLLEYENGRQVYALEWYANGAKYEYDIAVDDGSIVSMDYEAALVADPSVQPPATASVTVEQAKQTALDHAGVTASAATFVKAERDYENGRLVYEVEFVVVSNGSVTEYDYEIDAATGKIVSYDYDIEGYVAPVTTPAPSTSAAPSTSTGTSVTVEQAKQTALDHAGVTASAATFVKAERDYENGRLVYEVEFVVVSGGSVTEYDYEIDAATGKIVSYDYDIEGYVAPAGGGTAVTSDTAKQTALARVPGATAANLYEWEYDFDDGRGEYEGKIIYDGMEYEFTIDAATGSITEWEVEPWGR